jgi:hypothetical protein
MSLYTDWVKDGCRRDCDLGAAGQTVMARAAMMKRISPPRDLAFRYPSLDYPSLSGASAGRSEAGLAVRIAVVQPVS